MEHKIFFHNRYTGKLVEEKVYGEKWLKLIYENPLGKLILWTIVKRNWFSKWYGWRMNLKGSVSKIIPFIGNYGLDVCDFEEDVTSFNNFNEFFFRKLKKDSRPITTDSESAIYPADGRHLGLQNVNQAKSIFVKGQKFNLEKLFGSLELADYFKGGSLVLSRLCPVDYHRFHFPVAGKLASYQLINGNLFSVNPIALRKKISIFWENKRFLAIIENEILGKVAIFLVGATCVGTVHLTAKTHKFYDKGQELGYFSFGGSSVITIFQHGKINLDQELLDVSSQGYEFYSKMGETMGKTVKTD